MAVTRKSRKLPFPLGGGSEYSTFAFKPGYSGILPRDERASYAFTDVVGSQVTDSENHPEFHQLKYGGLHDVGGGFFSQKRYVEGNPTNVRFEIKTENNVQTWRYRTINSICWPFDPRPQINNLWPPYTASTDNQLNQAGTKAVALSNPTNAIINVGTSLGELIRERLPAIPSQAGTWQTRADIARSAGSEYLNAEFGWEPLKRDVRNVAVAIADAENIVSQFRRDAGKVVRRRWNFPIESSSSISLYSGTEALYVPFDSSIMDGNRNIAACNRFRVTTKRQWFSGAFTYHVPADWTAAETMGKSASNISKVLDVSLTPETIWNLTPWSWAVDWFSSAGDAISNLSDWAQYGLVMRYGYLMEHTITKDTYTRVDQRPFKDKSQNASGSLSFVSETKRRVKANPFGFGVSWSGLSPFQLSIAAALGMSRS